MLKSVLVVLAVGFLGCAPQGRLPAPDGGDDAGDVPTADAGADANADAGAFVVISPLDTRLYRAMTYRNDAGGVFSFAGTLYGPDNFNLPLDRLGIAPHPQPAYLYVDAGEARTIQIVVEWGDIGLFARDAGWSGDYRMDFSVARRDNPDASETFSMTSAVRRVDIAAIPVNATVSGIVYDADGGLPLSGTEVEVSGAPNIYRTQTGGDGRFSVGIIAYRGPAMNGYAPYNVRAKRGGYEDWNHAVIPVPGLALTIDAGLTRFSQTATFTLEREFAMPLNVFRADATSDGRFFVLAPFHSGLSADDIRANAALHLFDVDAGLVWKWPMPAETPSVDIADDGTFVATVVADQAPADAGRDPGAYLIDRDGGTVWAFKPTLNPDFKEMRLSRSNAYAAVGSGQGDFYFLDRATRNVLWYAFLGGQVRWIEFAPDDSQLYAGAGDGALYAFALDGGLRWRRDVGGWPHAATLLGDTLFVSGKMGGYIYALTKDGDTLWSFPVDARADALRILPGQSGFLYQTTIHPVGTAFFTAAGTLDFFLGASTPAGFSSDGELVLTQSGAETGTVSLVNRRGHVVWSDTYNWNGRRATGDGYAWISPDKTRLVIAGGWHVRYYRGNIQ